MQTSEKSFPHPDLKQIFLISGQRLGIVVCCLLIYGLTMPKTITLEDAGLFQMICHLGGIAHPPGYPLFTMLCQPLVKIPLSPVMAGNLVSALFATATALLLFEISRHYFKRTTFAFVFTLGYGFSLAFWSQAIIIEVYTLNTMMFAICWLLALKLGITLDVRYFYALAFCWSLALTNHWPLMVLSAPALIILLIPCWPLLLENIKTVRFWLVSTVLFLLGLTPYLILLQQNPEFALYGGIHSWEEFIAYVTRAYYIGSDQHTTSVFMDKFRYLGWLMTESAIQFGYVGIPLILLGLLFSFRRFDIYTNLGLLFLFSSSVIFLPFLLGFDFDDLWQAIYRPYPLLSYMVLAFWMTCGFACLSEKISESVSWFPVTAGSFLILVILLSNFRLNNRHDDFVADTYGKTLLATLDQNSSLFVTGDASTGVLGYLHYVERIRPDIQLYQVNGLLFPNRLGSPIYDSADRFTAINRDYMSQMTQTAESSNSVYSLDHAVSPSIEYGIYVKYNPEGPGTGYLPEVESFFDLILMADIKQWITAPHEKSLVFHHIYQLTHQYLKYYYSIPRPTTVQTSRLGTIEKTFPGKLAMLYQAPGNYLLQRSKAGLLQLAMEAEKTLPDGLRAHYLSLLYHSIGKIHLMDEPDLPRDVNHAIFYFERSIESKPLAGNRSICLLHHLYLERGKNTGENMLLKNNINSDHCEKSETNPGQLNNELTATQLK